MQRVPISELTAHTSELIHLALGGEKIIVTENGKPLVELKPLDINLLQKPMTRKEAAERKRQIRKSICPLGIPIEELMNNIRK